jgi:16S rRNA C1402 N4-methylase RsmH
MIRKEIEDLLFKNNDEEVLDDEVHDIMSANATNINNEGYKAQIDFILKEYGEEVGLERIKEIINENG